MQVGQGGGNPYPAVYKIFNNNSFVNIDFV